VDALVHHGPGEDVGPRGRRVTLHREQQWIRDVTIKTGLADTFAPEAGPIAAGAARRERAAGA
jgi:DNA topoisomerase IB